MKRINRTQQLTPEEAAQYQVVREEIESEVPRLIERHLDRMTSFEQLDNLLMELKAARLAKGLSLAQLTEMTGMDRSALSKLENGLRANPTVETLTRYAEAVGKRLVMNLEDIPAK